jgi:hypothetical protein
MEDGHDKDCNGDHSASTVSKTNDKAKKGDGHLHTVENDEFHLVLHDRIAPPACHLGDSIRTTD